jgi:hypothetical protein
MNFNLTSIAAEVNNIIKKTKNAHGFYTCKIFVKDHVLSPHKIVNIDIFEDYLNNYSEEIIIDLYLSSGTYENIIVPNKENIEIKIFNTPMPENNTTEDKNQEITIIEGRAVLTTTDNQFFSNKTSVTNREDKDRLNIQLVRFQVINPILEPFRLQSAGGIYRQTTGIEVIKTLLVNGCNINRVDEKYKVKGSNVVPGFNNEIKNQISIPQGTKISDIPDYINKNIDGIYPTGFGFYLKKNIWYLYPTYDVDHFDKVNKTLTILKVPGDVLPIIDRTYEVSNGCVTIIANKGTMLEDRSDQDQLNKGNGLRFTDAKSIMDGFVEVVGNIATASRGKNVSEFIMDSRNTGLNNVISTGIYICSNMFYEMSKLSKRNGSIVEVAWEYSDSSLLYPCMPVKFVYQQGNNTSTIYGVLLAVHEMITLEGKGFSASKHKRSCKLSIFVKRRMEWNEDNIENE